MHAFAYHRATAAGEAVRQHQTEANSAYLAGGTTLIDLVKLDVMQPARVVDINRIGLTEIESLPDRRMKIGAMVRNSDLARHPLIRARYPGLAEALLSGASSQLRNMATTGGNLLQRTRCPYFRDAISPCNKREPGSGCAAWDGYNRTHAVLGGGPACIATHPSDMCVALAALDAEIVVRSERRERAVPLADFFLLPGETPDREHALAPSELITAVLLPALPKGARSWYVKLRDRASYEFALASAAVVLRLERNKIRDVRIALGGVGTKPWRSPEAEAILGGATPDAATFRRAAEAAFRTAQPREHNAFKLELGRRVIVHALSVLVAGQPQVSEL